MNPEKATKRELQQTQKLLKEKQQQEKRELREKERAERARVNAVKAAEVAKRKAAREAQKSDRDAGKSTPLPNQGKRKASSQLQSKIAKKHGGGAARSRTVANQCSPTPPPTYNSRGRKIAPPRKFG